LLETDASRRKALIVHDGELHPVPAGFQLLTPSQILPLVTTPLLSLGGKLRALGEYFVPKRTETGDESLASFAVRRLGREAYERLVQPLVGGIYTADPEQLSMQAALPRFVELEKQYGSLMRAARELGGGESAATQQASGARYSLFVAPRDGMQRIVDALVATLPAGCVRFNTPVTKVERTSHGWQLATGEREAEAFDGLIVALPAPQASQLFAATDAGLAADLGKIPYAGASVVVSGYELRQIENPLEAFGFVVPEIERRDILAASFSSRKFPGRAPERCVLIRTFLGGALRPDLIDRSDDELRAIVARELKQLLGVRGDPNLSLVQRWRGAMPQYHLGHVELVKRIFTQAGEHPGLALAGNAYDGVGMPQCIRSGRGAAERILGV
jgi:oxygen-dependent protoporphyrinogen oxidase